jgi:hypothetical protein
MHRELQPDGRLRRESVIGPSATGGLLDPHVDPGLPTKYQILLTRSAGNPNIARRHNNEFAGRQLVSVFPQRLI